MKEYYRSIVCLISKINTFQVDNNKKQSNQQYLKEKIVLSTSFCDYSLLLIIKLDIEFNLFYNHITQAVMPIIII